VNGTESGAKAVAEVLGHELAERFAGGLQRVLFGSTRTPHGECRPGKDGQRVGKRFRARPRFVGPGPEASVRARRSRGVDGPLALLLAIMGAMRSGEKRAWHFSLWLGRPDVKWQHAGGLATRLRASVRTLERWLAALRAVGALKNWQPLGKAEGGRDIHNAPQCARTNTGRFYACYELPFDAPRELLEWWGACAEDRGKQARETEREASAPSTFAVDVAGILAELDARADTIDAHDALEPPDIPY